MELYAKEYATPFLLDISIKNNVLYEFVNEIISSHNERIMWQIYNSHKLALYGVDFEEFKNNSISNVVDSKKSENNQLPVDKLIAKNHRIMSEFKPKGGDDI